MDRGFSSDDANENAFYAQLTRQILLLTDEDNEEQTNNKSAGRFINHRLAGRGGGWSVMPRNYFSWSEGGEVPVPGWMERLWAANGGGTGVFIPRGGEHRSRRRHNKPRKNTDRGRAHPAAGHKNL